MTSKPSVKEGNKKLDDQNNPSENGLSDDSKPSMDRWENEDTCSLLRSLEKRNTRSYLLTPKPGLETCFYTVNT